MVCALWTVIIKMIVEVTVDGRRGARPWGNMAMSGIWGGGVYPWGGMGISCLDVAVELAALSRNERLPVGQYGHIRSMGMTSQRLLGWW